MTKKLVFLGCSGNFKKFTQVAECLGYQVVGIIDDHYYGNTTHWQGIPVLESEKNIKQFLSTCQSDVEFFVSVPLLMRNPVVYQKRMTMLDTVAHNDLPCANLIDPLSKVGDDVKLGHGVWVGAFSVIQHGCELNDHVWVRDLVFIGHGSTVDSGTLISTQSYLGGDIRVGKNCLIGIKSSIIPRANDPIYIGDNSMTHPTTLILDDVPPGVEMCINGTSKPLRIQQIARLTNNSN